MTSQIRNARRATGADAETAEEATAAIGRDHSRDRFWRLAIGGTCLFWVCALLALMR